MAGFNDNYSKFQNIVSQQNEIFDTDTFSQGIEIQGVGSIAGLNRTRLVSKGDMINIRDNFIWKNGGDATSTEEVPALILEEKTLSMTGMAATLTNIYNEATDRLDRLVNQNQSFISTITEPYARLYVIENNDKPFKYKIPWLLNNGSNLRTITNQWTDVKGNSPKSSGSSGVTKEPGLLGKVAGFTAGLFAGALTPGMEIDPIYTYNTTDNMALTVRFPLYNTYNIKQTIKNFYFTTLLTYQNLKNRTSLVTFVPPSVYTVSSEGLGGVYMPIAVMREIKINNIGTVRQITDDIIPGQTILIPEGYEISFTLQELLPQSTNIFEGAIGGARVNVTDTSPIGTSGGNTREN